MVILVLQTALLLAIAFILGAVIGCLLHRFVGFDERRAPPPRSEAPAAAPAASVTAKREQKPAAPVAPADDLKRIRGIGRMIEARLHAAGITTFAQVASWKKVDRERISAELDFKGRIEREDWVGQAKVLAKGGETAFSKRVARGEVETSRGKAKKQHKQ